MIARFPRAKRREVDQAAESEMGLLMAVVTAVRNVRSEVQIPPARVLAVVLRPAGASQATTLGAATASLAALARADVRIDLEAVRPRHAALAMADGCEVYVPLEGVIDLEAERQRLSREIRRSADELGRIEAKLARPEFRERAPADVVAREEARLREQTGLHATLREALTRLDALDTARD